MGVILPGLGRDWISPQFFRGIGSVQFYCFTFSKSLVILLACIFFFNSVSLK